MVMYALADEVNAIRLKLANEEEEWWW